jgi:hypothetical protein
MTVYPGLVPTGQQRPQAFMAMPGPYSSPGFLPDQQQQQPLNHQALPLPHQTGTPGSARVGTSNRWLTPSTP